MSDRTSSRITGFGASDNRESTPSLDRPTLGRARRVQRITLCRVWRHEAIRTGVQRQEQAPLARRPPATAATEAAAGRNFRRCHGRLLSRSVRQPGLSSQSGRVSQADGHLWDGRLRTGHLHLWTAHHRDAHRWAVQKTAVRTALRAVRVHRDEAIVRRAAATADTLVRHST